MSSHTLSELLQRRSEHLQSVFTTPSGLNWCQRHSDIADLVIREVFRQSAVEIGGEPSVAIVATGGYGRRELAPFSDLDLAVIPSSESDPLTDQFVRLFHRKLHDEFKSGYGLEVGYSYRTVSDIDILDPKSRTGFLDSRWVAGDPRPFNKFQSELDATQSKGEFLLSKLQERNNEFLTTHATPLVVEPNLKSGSGGLRCHHCSNWIRKTIGIAQIPPSEHYDILLKFRNWLHAVAGKPLDRLSRQRQAEIADRIGQDPAEFMPLVVQSLATTHEEFLDSIRALRESRFEIAKGVWSVKGEARLDRDATVNDAANGIALATDLNLEIEPLSAHFNDEPPNPSLVDALARGSKAIRNLDRCGILDEILPELTRTRVLMPTDSVHTFTVFEHTLKVLENVEGTKGDPFFELVRSGFNNMHLLVLAILLHDVGKADASAPHSETGARMAREVCARWHLAQTDTDFVVWLVENHLILDRTLRFRDLYDPSTIEDFAAEVGTLDRLDALTLLTYADVNAVSPDSWTQAQDSMLRELYRLISDRLKGEQEPLADPNVSRRALMSSLGGEEIDAQELQEFLNDMSASYVVSASADLAQLHFGFVKRAIRGENTVLLHPKSELGLSELTVCCPDQPGLLKLVLGALYALDLTLHELRVHTTNREPQIALDFFLVSFAGRELPDALSSRVIRTIESLLAGQVRLDDVISQAGLDPHRNQEHLSSTFVPGKPAILEIRAPLGRGIGYRLSRWISDQNWNIVSARFGQWAGRGAAAFYITGPNGTQLTEADVNEALTQKV